MRERFFPLFCGLSVVALLLAVPWFLLGPVHFDAFAGDDLGLWHLQKTGASASNFLQALTDSDREKYRPVAYLLYFATYKVFGGDFRAYILFNLIFQCLMAAAIGVLIARCFDRKFLVGAMVCVLVVSSRFAYYAVLQRIGIVEGWALLFFALSTWFAVDFHLRGRMVSAWWALGLFGLCIYTHERYVVSAAFLTLAFIWTDTVSIQKRLLLALFPALLVVSNIFVKAVILHTHFLTGTGGEHIKFNFPVIGAFMGAALANIFGFNHGPDYLAACDVRNLGAWAYGPGILMTAGFLLLGAGYLLRFRGRAARSAILFLSLLVPLLLSASITFRQEFRWIYAPELALLMATFAMAAQLARAGGRWRAACAGLGLFVAGDLAINVIVREHLSNVFFIAWMKDAESVRDTIAVGYRDQIARRPVYTIDGAIDPELVWAYFDAKSPVVIPIPRESLSNLTAKERKEGLFFARHEGEWQAVNVPPDDPAVQTVPGPKTATASDVEAIPGLREVLLKSSENWYYTLQVGTLLMAASPAKAEYYLRESIRLIGSENPYPYFYLGELLRQETRLKEAQEYYRMAVQFDNPANPNPAFANALAAVDKLIRSPTRRKRP